MSEDTFAIVRWLSQSLPPGWDMEYTENGQFHFVNCNSSRKAAQEDPRTISLQFLLSNCVLWDKKKDFYREAGGKDENRVDAAKDPSSRGDFCDNCLKLDFHAALNLDIILLRKRYTTGFAIANVGTRFRHHLETKCPSCLILSRSRIAYTYESKRETYEELRPFSFWKNFHEIEGHLSITGGSPGEDSVILAIVPSTYKDDDLSIFSRGEQNGYVFLQNTTRPLSDLFAAQIIPRHFDVGYISKWIEYRKTYHTGLCSEIESQASHLKLIDCKSRTVKTAPPDASYVALSYVWGQSLNFENLEDDPRCSGDVRLPSHLPTVVIDAINVTKALSAPYLWVDKYWVDQKTPDIKAL
jgi:hypothetical protein